MAVCKTVNAVLSPKFLHVLSSLCKKKKNNNNNKKKIYPVHNGY